jgi:hypothetical protein
MQAQARTPSIDAGHQTRANLPLYWGFSRCRVELEARNLRDFRIAVEDVVCASSCCRWLD